MTGEECHAYLRENVKALVRVDILHFLAGTGA
jgi:hypothetical protein